MSSMICLVVSGVILVVTWRVEGRGRRSESRVSESTRAATTVHRRSGGLNRKHSFFTVLEARCFEIRVPAWLSSW